ncbi:galactosyltransferase domain-containing protein [Phthorimaea operculella]|nr:galactosyltransferase domain-containing protein [Phthorimaea operculella]
MASEDAEKQPWDDEDRFYSSSHSDDSPILAYRFEKRRYKAYTCPRSPEDREKRSTVSVLVKFCLFCAAMILFCVLMYIPVYNKADYRIPRKGFVAGWSVHTNRDTKIYVQPNAVTTIYEPKNVCLKTKANKLLLLVIVCSATDNFDRRSAIRDTWGSYKNYRKNLEVFNKVHEKYKNYDYKSDLYPLKSDLKQVDLEKLGNSTENSTLELSTVVRNKRDISSFHQLLPVLAKALTNISVNVKTEEVSEKRFDDEDDPIVPGFDMNKDMDQTENIEDFDYDYDTNIMKIPPKGYENEDDSPDLSKVLTMLKQSKDFEKIKDDIIDENPEFKLVFLLGMPSKVNSTIQKKIEEEIEAHNDIIQEGFIDSYNNLTLKSIMMLKWVTKKCNESVRYILKTDDDTYVNMPNLILSLKERAAAFDKLSAEGRKEKEYLLIGDVINGAKPVLDADSKWWPISCAERAAAFDKLSAEGRKDKEYLLIGDVINGAKPVLDADSKWFSPRYMYGGRYYPRYLSGMGYAMSVPTAHALYRAALSTHYFHLEDIYITGMCALRANPRIVPHDDARFSYQCERTSELCCAHAQVTAHRVNPDDVRALHTRLSTESEADRCERWRLTKVRQDQIRRKMKQKHGHKGLANNKLLISVI